MRQCALTGIAALVALVGLAGPALAQTETLPFDHVHLTVPDPPQAAEWYRKNIGGEPVDKMNDRLRFGPTWVIFTKGDNATSSAGSVIDHLSFSFADLDAKVRELETAGAKVVTPVRDVTGLFKLGFVEDPWGVRLELVQDAELLGFHHIHLRGPDPEAMLTWYAEKLGGERAKLKGRLDALKYGTVWVLVQRGDATPSPGHAIDHVSWLAPALDAKVAELKGKGVTVTTEPRVVTLATGVVHVAFIEGPLGAKIELVQR
jgi:catechol 2,3-dioxygenase-like lactoylglutathione lyase family enzyme